MRGLFLKKSLKLQHLLLLGGIATIAAATPAQAVVQYQTVGPVSFTFTHPSTNNPASIAFAPFSAAPAAQLQMVSLTGPTFNSAPMLNYGGTITGGQFTADPVTYSATSSPLFKFSNSQAFSGSASNVPLAGNPVTSAGLTALAASGSYSGSFNMIDMPDKPYFAGTPTVNVYSANFNTAATTGGGIFGNVLTLSSTQLYLTYKYDDGVTGVPAPLPIVGASVAFGFARKLRRRIQSSAS